MGLDVPPEIDESWKERGYLTIMRNNWHLLNYEQLLQLLDWDAAKLAFVLKEEDFMWSKVGRHKPVCAPLKFSPLDKEEKRKTGELKENFLKHFPEGTRKYTERPFQFLSGYKAGKGIQTPDRFDFNFLHPFSASYGDIFGNSESDPVPEELLKQYAAMGIKGIWLQIVLYTFHPIKGAEEFSKGYEKRLRNLEKLVEKCARYNIGVYLYLNEPRSMPEAFYEKFPHWQGISRERAISKCICTSQSDEPLKWFGEACKNVFSKVTGLAGAFMITMCENPTHCYSSFVGNQCPYCKKRSLPDVVSEIVCTAEQNIHSAAPNAKVIVWDWGWRSASEPFNDIELEYEIIEKLPQNIYFMRVSEWGKETFCGKTNSEVVDYSISQVGPSERSVNLWKFAQERGIKTVAKIQLNNTWELSAVPYIPVPYLVQEHLDNLYKNNINGLMLSWSLGGYPDGNLNLINNTPEQLAEIKFGKEATPLICEAWKVFSEAFKQFPFHVDVIYFGPMNFGPANLFYLKKTEYNATMIGFPYDDLDTWRANYSAEVFEEQFRILSERWQEGIMSLGKAGKIIPAEKTENFVELENISRAAYCHFKSTCNIIKYVRLRDADAARKKIIAVLNEEIELTKELHKIVCNDSRIGFEASNHYYYTINDLKEKVLNCEHLLKQLK
jgi:DNA polymerase III delta prime subunit